MRYQSVPHYHGSRSWDTSAISKELHKFLSDDQTCQFVRSHSVTSFIFPLADSLHVGPVRGVVPLDGGGGGQDVPAVARPPHLHGVAPRRPRVLQEEQDAVAALRRGGQVLRQLRRVSQIGELAHCSHYFYEVGGVVNEKF